MLFSIVLFFLLPAGLTNVFRDEIPGSIAFVVIEKLVRIAIFLGYLWLISRMPDLQRVFQYHGAEHKTISCYEAGKSLTPENAQRFSRFHPRYATTSIPTLSSSEAWSGFSTASTASSAAIATASCARSGSRVVSRWSCIPGHMRTRAHR